ncbi:hypothetical protein [Pyrobaculum neutrophilum]|uniref:Uncharacterized protein n=1 Tax=Pyrobaculum neutrophilum (strain DSM 2338 / JCM 9278 / NBRC 100436 / V24Sta) TaxID=444157 RepID=B1YAK2_PYRNV|nr:hypothetical protein [Pyrobaculum neutrophilum]ACB40651.1 conserved hypothetical protein [Pyrobaculum neutrophilum V24Sta]
MATFRCPICGREVKIELRIDKEPVGGLHEVLVQHESHYVKVYIDRQGVVRRAFPVEHFTSVDPPLYTVYIFEDRAEIVDGRGHVYVVEPNQLAEVVKKLAG